MGLESEFNKIKGIGPKAIKSLLLKFESVNIVKLATLKQLEEVVGAK